MTMVLKGHNKFSFVDRSLPTPYSTHPDYARWYHVNNIVKSWILHSIHHSLAHTVLYTKDVAIELADLKSQFSTINGPHIYELECLIAMLCKNDDSIVAYYNKLRGHWDELTLTNTIF